MKNLKAEIAKANPSVDVIIASLINLDLKVNELSGIFPQDKNELLGKVLDKAFANLITDGEDILSYLRTARAGSDTQALNKTRMIKNLLALEVARLSPDLLNQQDEPDVSSAVKKIVGRFADNVSASPTYGITSENKDKKYGEVARGLTVLIQMPIIDLISKGDPNPVIAFGLMPYIGNSLTSNLKDSFLGKEIVAKPKVEAIVAPAVASASATATPAKKKTEAEQLADLKARMNQVKLEREARGKLTDEAKGLMPASYTLATAPVIEPVVTKEESIEVKVKKAITNPTALLGIKDKVGYDDQAFKAALITCIKDPTLKDQVSQMMKPPFQAVMSTYLEDANFKKEFLEAITANIEVVKAARGFLNDDDIKYLRGVAVLSSNGALQKYLDKEILVKVANTGDLDAVEMQLNAGAEFDKKEIVELLKENVSVELDAKLLGIVKLDKKDLIDLLKDDGVSAKTKEKLVDIASKSLPIIIFRKEDQDLKAAIETARQQLIDNIVISAPTYVRKDDAFFRETINNASAKELTPIIEKAVKENDLELLEKIPSKYLQEWENEKKENLLHVAMQGTANGATVQMLIDEKVDINKRDAQGKTPLHHIIMQNAVTIEVEQTVADIIGRILVEGADANIADKNGKTPLHYAVQSGKKWLVDEFVVATFIPVDINLKDFNGQTALHYAAESGNIEVADALINADVNAKDNNGLTPLDIALKNEKIELAQSLIEYDEAKNVLHIAAKYEGSDVIKIIENELRKEGADIDEKDEKGRTPLHIAVASGNMDAINVLLARGADVNVMDNTGMTPLAEAKRQGRQNVLEKLQREPLLIISDDSLHLAAKSGDLKAISFLIVEGLDVNMQDKDGKTPLHYAMEKGNVDAAKSLIISGADLSIKDLSGKTPKEFASSTTLEVINPYIESNTVKFYHKDKEFDFLTNVTYSPILFVQGNKASIPHSSEAIYQATKFELMAKQDFDKRNARDEKHYQILENANNILSTPEVGRVVQVMGQKKFDGVGYPDSFDKVPDPKNVTGLAKDMQEIYSSKFPQHEVTSKEFLMCNILLMKLTQNPEYMKAVLDAHRSGKRFVENTMDNRSSITGDGKDFRDAFWGNAPQKDKDGKYTGVPGNNGLGKALDVVAAYVDNQLQTKGSVPVFYGLTTSCCKAVGINETNACKEVPKGAKPLLVQEEINNAKSIKTNRDLHPNQMRITDVKKFLEGMAKSVKSVFGTHTKKDVKPIAKSVEKPKAGPVLPKNYHTKLFADKIKVTVDSEVVAFSTELKKEVGDLNIKLKNEAFNDLAVAVQKGATHTEISNLCKLCTKSLRKVGPLTKEQSEAVKLTNLIKLQAEPTRESGRGG